MHLVGFIIKKFVTMHGHMKVKKNRNSPGTEKSSDPTLPEIFSNLFIISSPIRRDLQEIFFGGGDILLSFV